jgi:cation diffusion facilitator family transporter
LLITVTGNILLSIAKGFAAYLSNSSAIFADMVNSFSDVAYSIFLVAGLWLSKRPPDKSHPQGHSRFEPFAALIVTIAMTFAAYEAGRSAIMRFSRGEQALTIGLPLIILLVAAAIKVLMYVAIHRAALESHSPGLDAAAKDNLGDVLTTIAAGAGVLGAHFINPIFDPIAGLLVAVWILRSVVEMARENLGYLTGAGASQDLLDKYVAAVKTIENVNDVHHVITEYAGPKLVVDMHINVDGKMSLDAAHAICDRVVSVLEEFPEVDRAYVHLEPIGHH